MLMFLTMFIFIFLLSNIICFLGTIISMKLSLDQEKMSPFECGFTPKFTTRLPFSMRFFLLALIFLIFDVELILFFPFSVVLILHTTWLFLFWVGLGIIILKLGLFHEWNQNSLDWTL